MSDFDYIESFPATEGIQTEPSISKGRFHHNFPFRFEVGGLKSFFFLSIPLSEFLNEAQPFTEFFSKPSL